MALPPRTELIWRSTGMVFCPSGDLTSAFHVPTIQAIGASGSDEAAGAASAGAACAEVNAGVTRLRARRVATSKRRMGDPFLQAVVAHTFRNSFEATTESYLSALRRGDGNFALEAE